MRATAQLTEIRPRSEFDGFYPSACYLLSQPFRDYPAFVVGAGRIVGQILVWTGDHTGLAREFVGVWQPGSTHDEALAGLGYQLLR